MPITIVKANDPNKIRFDGYPALFLETTKQIANKPRFMGLLLTSHKPEFIVLEGDVRTQFIKLLEGVPPAVLDEFMVSL